MYTPSMRVRGGGAILREWGERRKLVGILLCSSVAVACTSIALVDRRETKVAGPFGIQLDILWRGPLIEIQHHIV